MLGCLGGRLALVLLLSVAIRGGETETVSARYDRGVSLYGKRNLEGAKSEFLQIVQSAPPAPRSRYYLGRIALLESKPAEAIGWLAPLAEADPPVFDALGQLAKAYGETGQLEKARACIERALRAAPWDGSLHYRLARVLQQIGQPELARAEFQASARSKFDDRESVERLLECSSSLAKGDLDRAILRQGSVSRKDRA